MGNHQALTRALEEIRKRQSVRTPILASILDMDDAEVDALLAGPRACGQLITCDVEVSGKKVIEYRLSASGGGVITTFSPTGPKGKPVDPVKARLKEWGTKSTATGQASAPPSKSPTAHEQAAPVPVATKQEDKMPKTKGPKLTERALSALRQHGRLSVEQWAKHVGTTPATIQAYAATLCRDHGVRRVEGQRGVYELANLTPSPATARKANGSSPYTGVLKDLEARRATVAAELAKIDAAISAVKALA